MAGRPPEAACRTVPRVLRPYRELLSTPGGFAFSTAGFVARMPMAMLSLGMVLLVAGKTGRYGVAGAVAATQPLVGAIAAPMLARLTDRVGQRAVLLPAVAAQAVALAAFIGVVVADLPTWTWFLTSAATGAAGPSLGSMVRARWGHVLGPGPRLQTAYSYESVVDELIFILGPLIVTLLATRINPQAGLVAAIVLLVTGTLLLVSHRGSEPPAAPSAEHGSRSALRFPGMPLLVAAMVLVGGVFGGVEISAVAFADEVGHASLAGPLLACYAAGSMLAGLAYGAIHWHVSLTRRLLLGSVTMAATVALLPFVHSAAVLAPLLFLAGLGIAPTLISGLSLVERMVPAAKMTEGLTWATTGIVVGMSVASPIAGRIVDQAGAPRAFTVGLVSGLGAVAVCVLGSRHLHGRSQTP
jgi:MFS family permease